MHTEMTRRLQRNDLVYPNAGRCWQDGHILGNGDVGAVCYAPYGVEWTINKTDVFDGRSGVGKLMPDSEVRQRWKNEGSADTRFLNALEEVSFSPLTKSCGVLKLRFDDEYSWAATRPYKIEQRLHLAEATQRLALDTHGSHPRLASFVSASRNVLAVRLEKVGGMVWNSRAELVQPFDVEWPSPTQWSQGDGWVAFVQEMPHRRSFYAMVLRATAGGPVQRNDLWNRMVHPRNARAASHVGGSSQNGDRAAIALAGNADLFLAVATGRTARGAMAQARALAARAQSDGYAAMHAEHARRWTAFWRKSWVEFPGDPAVERNWYFSLYETASLLRKAPVPGIDGLWTGHTDAARQGVHAGYCHDQNAQIPIFPVFAVNHPELAEPFLDTYLSCLARCVRETRKVYERPGVCLPLITNQLGMALTGGSYRYSLIGSAYVGLIFVWAYRSTGDRRQLRRKIYPFLREVVRFYSAWMLREPDGAYKLDLMISPEIHTLDYNDPATLALLRPCLQLAVEASEMFGVDARERVQWQDILSHYPAYPTREGQLVNGDHIPLDHYVQVAYLLYPLCLGGDNSPRIRKLVANTLDHTVERDIEVCFADDKGRWHLKRGWALLFATITALRLGRTQQGWAGIEDFLRLYLKPNGLFTHNPIVRVAPEITEANLKNIPKGKKLIPGEGHSPHSEWLMWQAGVAVTQNPLADRLLVAGTEGNGALLMMVNEALLQSHGGMIRVFPGLPVGKPAAFANLRAEGGVLVSSQTDGHRVTRVVLRPTVPTHVQLANPWVSTKSSIRLRRNRRTVTLPATARFDLGEVVAGEEIILEPQPGAPPDAEIRLKRVRYPN